MYSAKYSAKSRGDRLKPILVMETAENWFGSHAMSVRQLVADRLWHRQRRWFGKPGTEACVRATSIVMKDPLVEERPQMPLV